MTYHDSDWQQAGVTNERDLNVYFYNEVSGQWSGMLPCPGCTHDIEANRFTIVLNDLSPFAVMGGLGDNRSYLPFVIKAAD